MRYNVSISRLYPCEWFSESVVVLNWRQQGSQSDVLVTLSTFHLFSFHLFIFHIVILWACQHTHLGVCELVSMGQEDLHKRAVHQQMENLSYYSVLNSKGVLIMCLDLEQQYATCFIVICYFALTGWDFLLKRLKEFGNHGISLLNFWTKSAKLKKSYFPVMLLRML